jgi:hypothetical protein
MTTTAATDHGQLLHRPKAAPAALRFGIEFLPA